VEPAETRQIDRKFFASVIVPVYNAERTLARCLESLVGLDYPQERYEVLVVDNNSTDQSRAIARRFPVRLLQEDRIQSSYAARNRGIQQARGEILAFTDADCVAAPDWLSELVAPFEDPTVGGVGGQMLDSEPEGEVAEFLASLQFFSNYLKDGSYLPVLVTGNSAYRREYLLGLGCFRDRLYTAADIDLAWRLQLETDSLVVTNPRAIIYHIHRADIKSMARQFRRHGFGEIFLDAMYKDQPGYLRTLPRQLRRMLRQSWALMVYLRAMLYWNLAALINKEKRGRALRAKYWFVIEANNLWGKLQGLWVTRLTMRNPAGYLWEDPGER
jgi:cellulose synthase/poly-beta-1,6-N-acetylglucosamine synthase-like glycosyltransferase